MSHAPFHDGERHVQARVGVLEFAERIGAGIRAEMPEPARAFLRERSFVIAASRSADGAVWTSLIAGRPGFIEPLGTTGLAIRGLPAVGDPLSANLRADPAIGLIALDFASRRRMRVNGEAVVTAEGLCVTARQVYANCPKYIRIRHPAPQAEAVAPASAEGTALSAAQRAWIAAADTGFIASGHRDAGIDASHRGGSPGFVRVLDARTLLLPDYAGNNMFQTLGNLHAEPAAGLLFVDFERGATLQLSGRTEILWDAPEAARLPGALRLLRFAVERVRETANATRLRWIAGEPSPFNPA